MWMSNQEERGKASVVQQMQYEATTPEEEYRLNQQMYTKAGKTFRALYESPDQVPENFILQIAFTHKASLLLTTDGRVFSWGEGPTLGIGAGEGTNMDEDKQVDES
mmetsp:Transcript_5818/g.6946  ORF Transcript_5818/g.6946 Transcript_5818/m.6946 type:complete len:106 (+) Transcript_5818:144-461(+)